MKKSIAYGVLFAIVASLCLCSFSVSAKVETVSIKIESVKIFVSRETADLQEFNLNKRIPGSEFGIITFVDFYNFEQVQNDPYLVRSKRWLKANKIEFTARKYSCDSRNADLKYFGSRVNLARDFFSLLIIT